MTAAERYWKNVSDGEVNVTLHVTVGDDEERRGLVGLTLDPKPNVMANLHSADPVVRTRATIEAMRDAARVVEGKFPRIKIVK